MEDTEERIRALMNLTLLSDRSWVDGAFWSSLGHHRDPGTALVMWEIYSAPAAGAPEFVTEF